MADPRLDLGREAYSFFLDKGLPDYKAAGLAGNLAWESGGKADTINPWDRKGSALAPHSFGISQWNDSRLAGLVDYARRNGAAIPEGDYKDVNYLKSIAPHLPLQTQLGYIWEELQGPEKRAFGTLNGATDLRSATAGGISYHRPAGWSWGNPTGGHGFGGRYGLADQIMRLGGKDLPPPGVEPSLPGSPTVTVYPSAPGRPMADPNPLDIAGAKWTPDEIIKQQYGLANQFRNVPQATSGWGALAQVLGGMFGGMAQGGADTAIRGNQDLQSKALKDAMALPDLKSQATALMKSGVPALEMRGAQILEQLGLKRAEQQEKFDMFGKLMGVPSSPAGAAPPSPGSPPPGGIPSGVPGVSLGAPPGAAPAPSSTPAMPAPSGSAFDKRRLGLAVAAGLISPEAAKLLMEDKSFDDAYDKKAGEDFAGAYKGYRESLPKISNMLGSYGVLEALIKNPATIQGMGVGARKQFDRAMEAIGIKTEGLAPTQVMEAISNEMTLQMRGAAGGMPGAMSDKDLSFLQAMTASTANSPEANLFLVQMRKRVLEREQMVAKMALTYAQRNGGRLDHRFDGWLQDWAEKNPLWSDKEMKALSGERDAAVKASPGAAGGTPKAAAAEPVGSERVAPDGKTYVKTGEGIWTIKGEAPGAAPIAAAPAPTPAAPRPVETPVQRAERRRAEAAAAPAKAAAEAEKVQASFNVDARVLNPLQMAQKYDTMRGQLSEQQRLILNQLIEKATAR